MDAKAESRIFRAAARPLLLEYALALACAACVPLAGCSRTIKQAALQVWRFPTRFRGAVCVPLHTIHVCGMLACLFRTLR